MPRAPLPAALGLALLVSACDSAPGASTGARNAAPTVTALAITPSAVFRDDLTVADGRVRIPISASAAVSDPEGRLDSVLLVVENPVPTATGAVRAPLVRVPMAASGGRYAATATLDLAANALGGYRVLVVAKDQDGRLGEGLALLSYGVRGRAPVVTQAVATVAGQSVTVVATVTDEDGLADVTRVEAVPANNPNGGDTFVLFDNGQGADAVAGDGRYTARFDVQGSGTLRLLVRAYDRAGLKSADVLVEARVGL